MGEVQGDGKKPIDRCDGSSGDDVNRRAVDGFGFGSDDRCVEGEIIDNALEEVCAEAAGFDQNHLTAGQYGNDDTGKASSRSNVEPGSAARSVADELRGIINVTSPEVINRRLGDKILTIIFFYQ